MMDRQRGLLGNVVDFRFTVMSSAESEGSMHCSAAAKQLHGVDAQDAIRANV